MKVIALKVFKEKNIKPIELNYVPEEGTIFEITKDRLDVLLGNNATKTVYVKVCEEPKIETANVDKKEISKKSSVNVKKRPIQK